ncbi:MAG: ABC transporter substrate-binding protein [Eggerthellaceae bacterium]|nr:ABC transporter substrate-binding protein [Eggerthellaceae bacterium]
MKKSLRTLMAGLLAVTLLAGGVIFATGCSGSQEDPVEPTEEAEVRIFTDSLGREVEIPANVERIAALSSTTEQVLITMAPDMLVGLCQTMAEDEKMFLGEELAELPVLGSYYNSKGDFNKESVAAANPQVIIDMGEAKKGIEEDLENLQMQLGIPVVFIETSLETFDNAYTMLGELLNLPERGKELADYCAAAYAETESVMANIPEDERVNMLYLLGDAGLNIIPANTFQSGVVDLVANNLGVVEGAKGSGQGMESSLEQIALWNPELIVFGPNSIYSTVADIEAWQGIAAIDSGNYYEVPSEPYSWLHNPPTVNQILGVQWLPRICYPQAYGNDLQEVVTEYYKLFYGYELTQAEYDELVAGATPKL